MNKVIDNIKNRRSIRKYLDKKIPTNIIHELIDAATYAPSSNNKQPWEFVVIRNKKQIDELSDDINNWFKTFVTIGTPITFIREIKKSVAEMRKRVESEKDLFFYHAPLVIILHGKKSSFINHDLSCAAQNMMLTARSLGIGSCWIGFADIVLNKSTKLKKKLRIPLSHQVVATLAFGYPLKFPSKALPRKQPKISFL